MFEGNFRTDLPADRARLDLSTLALGTTIFFIAFRDARRAAPPQMGE